MTKNDFMTTFIVEGKGDIKAAEEAWKTYREENGGTHAGFNAKLAEALVDSPMTEDEYTELVDRISPNSERPYARQFRWVFDLAQKIHQQYN